MKKSLETSEKRRSFVSRAPVDPTQRRMTYVSCGSTARSTKSHHFSEVSLLILLLVIVIMVGFGCRRAPFTQNIPKEIDRQQILFEAKRDGLIMNDLEIATMTELTPRADINASNPEQVKTYLLKDVSNWKSAALADVTGGGSFGLAFATREDGRQMLIAKMGNLPVLEEGYRYEGWLVRRTNEMSIISTGEVRLEADQFVNVFIADTDLSDYTFFVITLEPPDKNPSPAKHILEGALR